MEYNVKQWQKKKQYDGYCAKCYYKVFSDEIPIYNNKIKENEVVDFIKSIYTQEIKDKLKIKDIRFNKECVNTKKTRYCYYF